MALQNVRAIVGDLVTINRQFLRDSNQRATLRAAARHGGRASENRSLDAAELSAAPATAKPYAGLSGASLALAGITSAPNSVAHLNVVLSEISESGVFAGIQTALTTARDLAALLEIPLRVVVLDASSGMVGRFAGKHAATKHAAASQAAVSNAVAGALGGQKVPVVRRVDLRSVKFSIADVWLATHSKTAHAVDVACVAGAIDRSRVAYLIQDYEPGFSPASTESVVAASTYHAGFVPIVNSAPLRDYLDRWEGVTISPELVFAPQFEHDTLRKIAALRTPSATVRVLFYARPSKHRNLYGVGLSALRAVAAALGDATKDQALTVEFVSAGEPHRPIDLGNGCTLTSLGRMPWNEYFRYLATVQVTLSLQQSPHPSHPPFDAAISGGTAVTNEFHETRAGVHPRITAVPAETAALAGALLDQIRAACNAEPAGYLDVTPGTLGSSLDDVLRVAAARLTTG